MLPFQMLGFAEGSTINLLLDGKAPMLDLQASPDQSKVLLSFSSLSQALGGAATWDETTQTLLITKGIAKAIVRLDSRYVSINGSQKQIEFDFSKMKAEGVTSVIIHTTAMIKASGIQWDAPSKSLKIVTQSSPLSEGTQELMLLADLKVTAADTGLKLSLLDTTTVGELISGRPVSNNMLLVNNYNPVDKKYTPKDLVPIKNIKARTSPSNLTVSAEPFKFLSAMLADADRAGVRDFVITSAYRSYSYQKTLFDNKVSYYKKNMKGADPIQETLKLVAWPGSSEHQTGYAIDICSKSCTIIENFKYTVQSQWLTANSWKYGYIVRYGADKISITEKNYEPWHIRYVGLPHSELMFKKNMCMEEYMYYLKKNGFMSYKDKSGSEYLIFYVDKTRLSSSTLMVPAGKGFDISISNADKGGYFVTMKFVDKPSLSVAHN